MEVVGEGKETTTYTFCRCTICNGIVMRSHLPSVFGEMIHISRMIGNLGAHDAQRDISFEDANVSDQFFRAIIEYIYIAPNSVAKVKALMNRTPNRGL